MILKTMYSVYTVSTVISPKFVSFENLFNYPSDLYTRIGTIQGLILIIELRLSV